MKKNSKPLAYTLLAFAAWSLLVYGALFSVPTTTLAQFNYGAGSGCPPPPAGCVQSGCVEICQNGCSKVCTRSAYQQGASCYNVSCS
jgi:hypothetical protein